jgi:hypothetical protein
LAALRHIYAAYRTQIWGPYGFKDAFNPSKQWFATDYLGIDQGPIVLMIENYRTGRIWQVFMQHPAIQQGLARAGFLPRIEAQTIQPFPHLTPPTLLPVAQPTRSDAAPQPSKPEAPAAHPEITPQPPPAEVQPAQQRS